MLPITITDIRANHINLTEGETQTLLKQMGLLDFCKMVQMAKDMNVKPSTYAMLCLYIRGMKYTDYNDMMKIKDTCTAKGMKSNNICKEMLYFALQVRDAEAFDLFMSAEGEALSLTEVSKKLSLSPEILKERYSGLIRQRVYRY